MLYHQIHPFKIGVDLSTSITTTYLAWNHDVTWFLILFLMPSILVTALLCRFADLERLKHSVVGKYIAVYMTSRIVALRGVGQVLMWTGGWYQLPLMILTGVLLIAGAWLNGLLFGESQ